MLVDKETSKADLETQRLREALTFLGQARDVPVLRPSEVEQIACRLRHSTSRRRHPVRWPALITMVVLFIGGGTFAVAKGGLGRLPIVGPWLEPLFISAPPAKAVKPVPRRAPALHPVTETPPLPIPVTASPAPHPAPAPVVVVTPPSPPVHPAVIHHRDLAMRFPREKPERMPTVSLPGPGVAPPIDEATKNPLVEERQSFAAVLGAWHRTRAARPTLTLLDTHEQHYPNGDMRIEARVLRSVIYLAEGRDRDALSVLDSLSLAGIPRGRELQVVRGELRIKFGRCSEGKRDFDDVLAKGVADPLAQRAAQAIARCP